MSESEKTNPAEQSIIEMIGTTLYLTKTKAMQFLESANNGLDITAEQAIGILKASIITEATFMDLLEQGRDLGANQKSNQEQIVAYFFYYLVNYKGISIEDLRRAAGLEAAETSVQGVTFEVGDSVAETMHTVRTQKLQAVRITDGPVDFDSQAINIFVKSFQVQEVESKGWETVLGALANYLLKNPDCFDTLVGLLEASELDEEKKGAILEQVNNVLSLQARLIRLKTDIEALSPLLKYLLEDNLSKK